jgi:hypothetical protein
MARNQSGKSTKNIESEGKAQGSRLKEVGSYKGKGRSNFD